MKTFMKTPPTHQECHIEGLKYMNMLSRHGLQSSTQAYL